MKRVIQIVFVLIICLASYELGAQSYYLYPKNTGEKCDSVTIVSTAEELIASRMFKEGSYVRTLGYYKENDGGGGLFKIQRARPYKSETVLYYSLANGLFANCIDTEVVLPRYGGVYVNQMLDRAKPFLRPGIRDVIVLPPSNINHPGCCKYVSGDGSRVCFWLVNAPVLFDDKCSYSEVFFHDELVVASETEKIEAVLKIAGPNKPEDITFVTPVYVEGRHIEKNNTIVAEHALLIEDGARIIFGKLQASYAKNCITLGGGRYSNEIEFSANNIEASSFLERGLNINDQKRAVRVNIDKLQLQAPLGNNITWIYAHGNVTQSFIGTLFCSLSGSSKNRANYKVFDIVTGIKGEQVFDFGRVRISQCTEFGEISGGVYNIGTLVMTATPDKDINLIIGRNTTILCNYIQLANPIGNNWAVTGRDETSVLNVNIYGAPPKKVSKGKVTVTQKANYGN